MKNILAAFIVSLGLIGGGMTIADAKTSTDAPPTWWMKKQCKVEDDINCYWDAGTSGNHQGNSFIVRKVPGKKGMICVFYYGKQSKFDYCS